MFKGFTKSQAGCDASEAGSTFDGASASTQDTFREHGYCNGGHHPDWRIGRAAENWREKSDAAAAREASATKAFDDLRNTARSVEVKTTRLLSPSDHLTAACYRDFSKHVKSFPGWRASRTMATEEEKKTAGETRKCKVYWTDVTFRPKTDGKTQKKQTAEKKKHAGDGSSDGDGDDAPMAKKPKRYLWADFAKGAAVVYTKGDERRDATVVAVDFDGESFEPYYTIQFADGASPQRQTTSEKLEAAAEAVAAQVVTAQQADAEQLCAASDPATLQMGLIRFGNGEVVEVTEGSGAGPGSEDEEGSS